MATLDDAPSRPSLVISDGDYDPIANLTLSIERRSSTLPRQLPEDIGRARFVPEFELPPYVKASGSRVEFEGEVQVRLKRRQGRSQ